MKNEIKKTKSFDITTFETLNSEGKTLLKGGFSVAYEDDLAYTGAGINFAKGCQCTNTCNIVPGCACPITTTPTTA